jgi:uncharacterized zinc-type alcohol dehydrogenase-like protein
MQMFKAYAAEAPGLPFKPFEYDPGAMRPDEVEIRVTSCGICHSDLSMLENAWGMTQYPLVPGHEIIGVIEAVGGAVSHLRPGTTVGVGWFSRACMHCRQCMRGDHNLCPGGEGVIVGRHGGFADRVRCQADHAIPLPAGLDPAKAGPLLCGGITVFNPIVQFGVRPTDRVGVIGIGGLGHMAVQFLNKWGCEVTAFTSSDSKRDEAVAMGAHHVVNSRDPAALGPLAGSLDFVISTVNVPLEWGAYIGALAPRGRLHMVGAVLEPLPVGAMGLIMQQRSVSGSPVGSPATLATMFDFAARHGISPVTEVFPMSRVNDAFEHLRSGRARYRIVLEAGV